MKVIQISNKQKDDDETLIQTFLSDLRFSGKSDHTISNYEYDLRQFKQLVKNVSLKTTSIQDIRAYFQHLEGRSKATLARKQATLKSFFSWCIRNDYSQVNPMDKLEKVKLPEYAPRPLSDDILKSILEVIPKDCLRDRLLFTLIRETGVRVNEALHIRMEDISLHAGDEKIIIHKGKGGKIRTVMLYDAPVTLKLIKRYLNQVSFNSGALFRARESRGGTNEPMCYRSVYYLWKRYCDKADVVKNGTYPSIHACRHAYATEQLKRGVKVEVVSKLLGHKHLQTTLAYGEVGEQLIKEELIKNSRKKNDF